MSAVPRPLPAARLSSLVREALAAAPPQSPGYSPHARRQPNGPATFSAPLRLYRVPVGGGIIELSGLDHLAPACEADWAGPAPRPERDSTSFAGYLWPASVMLAKHILADEPGRGRPALEIGCGLGLPGIVAALAGWHVTLTDCDRRALRLAADNARRNRAPVQRVRHLDWVCPDESRRFDRIFGSDILYQSLNHPHIVGLICDLLAYGGRAVISDPNRPAAPAFLALLRKAGLDCIARRTATTRPFGRRVEGVVYQITRQP